MAVMKAKNNAGQWVEVAESEIIETKTSSFKMVWVPASADQKSYDLSPYLTEGDDFLLAFAIGTGSNACPGYLWQGSEGKLRPIDGERILLDNSTMKSHSPLEMIADVEASFSTEKYVAYDATSRKLTYSGTDSKFSKYAALIYAG